MNPSSLLWVWTPLFAGLFSGRDSRPDLTIPVVLYDPSNVEQILLSFRDVYANEGRRSITIFDIAHFPDDSSWCYVTDAVNRSGLNPLRGLGTVTRKPFIDLSYLYRVPAGETGREVLALGARYHDMDLAASMPAAGRPLCSHLHDAAILAHAEGLTVTGILVAESNVSRFDFSLFI